MPGQDLYGELFSPHGEDVSTCATVNNADIDMKGLTLDAIMEAQMKLEKILSQKPKQPENRDFMFPPLSSVGTYCGVELVKNSIMPVKTAKQQLGYRVKVSAKFRQDFNNWLREFFGEEASVYLMNSGRTLVAHPDTIREIKTAATKIKATRYE